MHWVQTIPSQESGTTRTHLTTPLFSVPMKRGFTLLGVIVSTVSTRKTVVRELFQLLRHSFKQLFSDPVYLPQLPS